jgi:hypothetical protein
MKYDLLLLDHDTRFSLWQVKMWTLLAQDDYEDKDSFGNNHIAEWTVEEKRGS